MRTERPKDIIVDHNCEECDAPIKVILGHYSEDGFKTWEASLKFTDYSERLCKKCANERDNRFLKVQEIKDRYPINQPAWFDPTIAGEVWDDSGDCIPFN